MIIVRAISYVMLLSPAVVVAQSITSSQFFPAHPVANHQAFPQVGDPVTIVAPLFIETGRLTTSLVLINNSESKVGTSIKLLDQSGFFVTESHTSLNPHEQQVIAIASLLASSRSQLEAGAVIITQDGNTKSKSIAAQLEIKDERGATPTYVDEEFSMPIIGSGSQSLRGVTDRADGLPLVAVLSTSEKPQRVSVRCISDKTESAKSSGTLQPNGSLLFEGCSAVAVDSVSKYLDRPDRHPADGRLTGIEVSGEGGPGSLAAFAIAPHIRNGSTIFSGAALSDPASIHSPNTIFAGVPIGAQTVLPDGIYVPKLSLANFSSSPAQVTVSLANSKVMDAEDADAEASNVLEQIRVLTIPPRHTVEMTMEGAGNQSGLLHSVQMTSDRLPGEVVGKLESRSDGTLFAVELLGKDDGDINNGGLHPWSLEGGDQSHLLIYNHSVKEQVFDVSIHSGSMVWDKKYRLAPQQTRELTFSDIIGEKIRDDQGRVLGITAHSGTVNWMVPDSGNSTGRLLVSNRSEHMARNYSCGNFYNICGLIVSTNDDDYIPLDNFITGFSGNPQFCNAYSPSQCYGNNVGGGSANFSNTLGPANIVRFNTSGDASSQSPNSFGVGAGSGYGSMEATSGSCEAGGQPSPAPQVLPCPTSVSVASTTPKSLPDNDEPTYKSGVGILAQMAVKPSANGATILETVTPKSNNCPSNIQTYTAWPTITASQNSTFTVGSNAYWEKQAFPTITGSYYDSHRLLTNVDVLGLTNASTCQATATQVYSCGGVAIGSFTLTAVYNHGTLSGQPVTNVTVTKK